MFYTTSGRRAFGANVNFVNNGIIPSYTNNMIAAFQSWSEGYDKTPSDAGYTDYTWVDMTLNGNDLLWYGPSPFTKAVDKNGYILDDGGGVSGLVNRLVSKDSDTAEKLLPYYWTSASDSSTSVSAENKTYVMWVRFRDGLPTTDVPIIGSAPGGFSNGFHLLRRNGTNNMNVLFRDKNNQGPFGYGSYPEPEVRFEDGIKYTMLSVVVDGNGVMTNNANCVQVFQNDSDGAVVTADVFSGTFSDVNRISYTATTSTSSRPFVINSGDTNASQYAGNFDIGALWVWDEKLSNAQINQILSLIHI